MDRLVPWRMTGNVVSALIKKQFDWWLNWTCCKRFCREAIDAMKWAKGGTPVYVVRTENETPRYMVIRGRQSSQASRYSSIRQAGTDKMLSSWPLVSALLPAHDCVRMVVVSSNVSGVPDLSHDKRGRGILKMGCYSHWRATETPPPNATLCDLWAQILPFSSVFCTKWI